MAESTPSSSPTFTRRSSPHLRKDHGLHHDKHHGIRWALTALVQLEARENGALATSPSSSRTWRSAWVATPPSIFWNNAVPESWRQAHRQAGSSNRQFFRLLDKFASTSPTLLTIQGSGWAILAWDTVGKRHHRAALRSSGATSPSH